MEFFTFLSKDTLHRPTKRKIIPAAEFSQLMQAQEVLSKAQSEALDYREEVAKNGEIAQEQAETAGFLAGMEKWSEQISLLEQEIVKVRKDMENAIVPLAMTAAKKIVGREIELKPDTVVDIVSSSLKALAQHRKIVIYVSRDDYDILEANRPRLKSLFEHLESLSIQIRDDISSGGCIIETEAGIINAQIENQWTALENAFKFLVQSQKKE